MEILVANWAFDFRCLMDLKIDGFVARTVLELLIFGQQTLLQEADTDRILGSSVSFPSAGLALSIICYLFSHQRLALMGFQSFRISGVC